MQTIFFDISNKYAISMEPKPEDGNVALQFKQGNVGQKIKAVIKEQENAYIIPNGAKFSVWFSGSSGEGNYSSIGDRSAFAIEGNSVTVELIAQMLINPGTGTMCLILNSADGSQLGLWNVVYVVEHVPGMGSKAAESYYTALSELTRQAIDAASTFETDRTLSISGKAADAAVVGAGLAGKAPAGYGLGESSGRYNGTGVNGVVKNGFYSMEGSTETNHPALIEQSKYGTLCTEARADFVGHTVRMRNEQAMRYSDDHGETWSEWEYVNPPMNVGVEYRTTKRYNGHPVYTAMIEFAALANKGTTTVNFATGAFRLDTSKIISINGVVKKADGSGGAYPLPMISEGTICADIVTNSVSATIFTHIDLSAYKASVVYEYIKD